MTTDFKYNVGQQVVVELEGSYRFGKITGYETVCSAYTDYEPRIKYELSVKESMLAPNGKEVPLDPRTVWQSEQRTTDLLARLKIEKNKNPDSKPATLLWNMRAAEDKPKNDITE